MNLIREGSKALQNLIDFILDNVKDPSDWEIQKRLNKIEGLFWECFDDYSHSQED